MYPIFLITFYPFVLTNEIHPTYCVFQELKTVKQIDHVLQMLILKKQKIHILARFIGGSLKGKKRKHD